MRSILSHDTSLHLAAMGNHMEGQAKRCVMVNYYSGGLSMLGRRKSISLVPVAMRPKQRSDSTICDPNLNTRVKDLNISARDKILKSENNQLS